MDVSHVVADWPGVCREADGSAGGQADKESCFVLRPELLHLYMRHEVRMLRARLAQVKAESHRRPGPTRRLCV